VGTIRYTHAVLHRALRDAVRWGRLVRNPADMADPTKAERSRTQAWTAKELARFLEHVQDDKLFHCGVLPPRRGCAAASFSASPGATSTSRTHASP
jgi:hypothetical protein